MKGVINGTEPFADHPEKDDLQIRLLGHFAP
jgi:hypothetical protein